RVREELFCRVAVAILRLHATDAGAARRGQAELRQEPLHLPQRLVRDANCGMLLLVERAALRLVDHQQALASDDLLSIHPPRVCLAVRRESGPVHAREDAEIQQLGDDTLPLAPGLALRVRWALRLGDLRLRLIRRQRLPARVAG